MKIKTIDLQGKEGFMNETCSLQKLFWTRSSAFQVGSALCSPPFVLGMLPIIDSSCGLSSA